MAVTLNASSSAGFVTTADTSTILQLQTNGTTAVSISSGQVATFAQAPVLPAASIPQAALATNVVGNGPAFGAYQSSAQTISNNLWTKIQFQTEEFDTNNNFDSSTNYRFTPSVAGYYQIQGAWLVGATGEVVIAIYKNGLEFKRGQDVDDLVYLQSMSALIYLNGSSDYVELYGYQSTGASRTLTAGGTSTWFSGSLVRSA
jgi:hypothetical protein